MGGICGIGEGVGSGLLELASLFRFFADAAVNCSSDISSSSSFFLATGMLAGGGGREPVGGGGAAADVVDVMAVVGAISVGGSSSWVLSRCGAR